MVFLFKSDLPPWVFDFKLEKILKSSSKLICFLIYITGAQLGGGKGEASPAIFWKLKKSALILEKK